MGQPQWKEGEDLVQKMDGLSRDRENCSASGSALSASFVPLWCHFGLRCSGWHKQAAAVQGFLLRSFLPACYAHFSTNEQFLSV